jgi:hypothetical protein
MEHPSVVCFPIFMEQLIDQQPREWMKQASTTLQDATEEYMVAVIAESHM